ncbi:hypothetical protein OOZ15_13330 [Galbibacter sp. EGI 63066]|uniref:hypothetical protein n=1 Tax=Galbibacter sp. EGI 63066 TaxID=2993559 RepID=UPI002248CCE8|nr:hypothetical protein [Galbibacter sp. EGI 63066]MCX2680929.1 hypothetical protein [Galbibacter sp. EGI 63066]
MEKTFFKNQTFQILIIVALGLLICWNLYTFLISKSLIALIPTIIQIIVLVLVLMKHKHAKMGINVWAVILMLGGGLVIIGKTIKLLIGDDISDGIAKLALNVLIFIAGLAIYNFNQKTVEVKQTDEK